tara:strand:+ start:3153 stop:3362 length:210 start_codon:yes stop_codon:yes gene_type:complete
MSIKKQYIFGHTLNIAQETSVMANSYEEAVELFTTNGGETEQVDSFDTAQAGDWVDIKNPDFEESNENL